MILQMIFRNWFYIVYFFECNNWIGLAKMLKCDQELWDNLWARKLLAFPEETTMQLPIAKSLDTTSKWV